MSTKVIGETRATPGWLPHLLLIVAVLAGAVFRLYQLDEQSLWLDDWNSMVYPPDSTLSDHMLRMRISNPDHVPLYFLLQYVWGHFIWGTVEGQRVFPVLLDLICVVLVYAVGARFNKLGAGIAAMLYALSPYHIYMAQALRPYSLLTLLTLASTLVLLEIMSRRKSRWMWGMLVLLYACMLWTHLTSTMMIASQLGMVLVLALVARRVPWAAVACASVAACICFTAMNYLPSLETMREDSYLPPDLRQIAFFLFYFDDVIANVELVPSNFALPAPLNHMTETLQPLFAHSIAAMLAGSLVLFTALLIGRIRRNDRDIHGKEWLLLASALGPPLAVLSISFLVAPMLMPRFILASTAFMYIVLSLAVQRLPGRVALAISSVLLLLYFVQATALSKSYTRTEWKQAVDHIGQGYREGDLIVFREAPGVSLRIHSRKALPYLRPGQEVKPAASFLRGVSFTIEFFKEESNRDNHVWILEGHQYEIPDMTAFEEIMLESGLSFERTDYHAMRMISVYSITPAATPSLRAFREAVLARSNPSIYLPALEALHVAPDSAAAEIVVEALAIAYDLSAPEPPTTKDEAAELAAMLRVVSPEQALEKLEVIARGGDSILASFALGVARMAAGDISGGKQAFATCKVIIRDPEVEILRGMDILREVLYPLLDAIDLGDCERVQAETDRIWRLGIALGPRMAWNRPNALIEAMQRLCGSGP